MTWEAHGSGTHIPLLDWALNHTSGPVLELGGGVWSTPFLRQMCRQRGLVTVENDPEWRGKIAEIFGDNTLLVPALTDELRSRHWGVVLVDNGPEIERIAPLSELTADVFVMHDSEVSELLPAELYPNYEGPRREIRAAMKRFTNFYECRDLMPRTALMSSVMELPKEGPAPIVVFAYNRPELLRQCLRSLAANPEAAESDLYIFCDGPATEADLPAVAAVRHVATHEANGFLTVSPVFAKHNRGPGACVMAGMDSVFNDHRRAIKVEDDVVVSPHFLGYINAALDLYEDEDEVAAISGFTYPHDTSKLSDTFLVSHDPCAAWGSWDRGWATFNPDARELYERIDAYPGAFFDFDFGGAYPFTEMLEGVANGSIHGGYDIRWYASLFLAGKLVLFPNETLIANTGYGSGAHCADTPDDPHASPMRDTPLIPEPVFIEENSAARQAFADHLRSTR